MRGIHAASHVPGSGPTRATAKAVDARWRSILILALPLGAFVLVQSFLPLGSAVIAGQDGELPQSTDVKNPGATIPPMRDAYGRPTGEGLRFSTEAYEREAFRLVLREANLVAQELKLPEKLPITEAELTERFILGYGRAQVYPRGIGTVSTRDHGYFVGRDHKLSGVARLHQDEDAMKWREQYKWPVARIDTNEAYQLATQWLASASMDVEGLNRDCKVRVIPSAFWNAGTPATGTFVPLYDVSWTSAERIGGVAHVSVFTPTKTLVRLHVYEGKYILRKPLEFENLEALLSKPEEE